MLGDRPYMTWKDLQEIEQARCAEYTSGQVTEDMFRASMMRLGYSGLVLNDLVREHAPPPKAPDPRMERSVAWMGDYLRRKIK